MIFNFKYLKLDYSHLQITESDFEKMHQKRTMGKEFIDIPDKKPIIPKTPIPPDDTHCSITIDSMDIINQVHQQYFGRNIDEEEEK